MERSRSHESLSKFSTMSNDEKEGQLHGKPSIWKYSRTRQIGFWMKKSVRNAITPNLNAVYEREQAVTVDTNTKQQQIHAYDDDNDNDDDGAFSEGCTELHRNDHDGLDDQVCENIDDAMNSLHVNSSPVDPTIPHANHHYRYTQTQAQTNSQSPYNRTTNDSLKADKSQIELQTRGSYDYDWLLDGNPMSELQLPLQEPLTNLRNYQLSPKSVHADDDDNDTDGDRGELETALSGLELEALSSAVSDDSTQEMMEGFQSILPLSCSNSTQGSDKSAECKQLFTMEGAASTSSSCDSIALERGGVEYLMRGSFPFPVKSIFRDLRNDHTWMESWNTVPEDLPFQDPSTPEGSFIRRLQVDRDRGHDDYNAFESDLGIPAVYMDENRDAVLEILESMPWDEGPEDSEELHGSMKEDTFLIERLSSLDELSQIVTNVLLQQVKRKESAIQLEMKRAQAVDHDITSALSYSRQAATYLQRVRGRDDNHGGSRAGALGGNYVIEEADQRDRLRQVDDLIKSIQDLSVMEASVFDFVDNFAANLMSDRDGIATLLETCELLKNRLLREGRFLKLSCLDESRERVSHIMEYLCKRIEEELMLFLFRRCKSDLGADNWNQELMKEYNTILDARIVFDGYRLQEVKTNDEGDAKDATTVNDFASQWSSIVFDALSFEAERCLPKALLDPTPTKLSDKEGPSDFDSNLIEIRSKLDEIQSFGQDAASLRSLTNNLFSIRLEFGQNDPNLVGIFHRLCSLLAKVLHAHHKIFQWHKEQANAAELCCSASTNDDESSQSIRVDRIDITVAKDDTTKSTSSSNCSRSSSCSQPLQQRSTNSADFAAIPQCISGPHDEGEGVCTNLIMKKTDRLQEAILSKRRDLWLHCKGILVKFLDTIFISKEDKETSNWSLTWRQDLESLSDIYKLCNQMNRLGKTFLSPEDARFAIPLEDTAETECELKDALLRLSENFINGAHVEAMTEVGTMMASETWDLLPIPLQKGADNDPITTIQSSINSFLSGVEASLCTPPSAQANARVWHNRLSRNKNDTFLELFAHGENPFMEVDIAVRECESAYTNIAEMPSKPNVFDDVGNLGPYREQLYKKIMSYTSTGDNELALASKSALNGLAQWSIRLVSIEAKLPIASKLIGTVLFNLYDLYFLTVFRLCAGNSSGEAIILGNNKRSDHGFQERFPKDISPPQVQIANLNRTSSFSRRRSTSSEISQGAPSRLINALVSRHCDADINAPLVFDEEGIARARKFIFRGQAALSTMVSLDQIERWALCHDEISRKDEMLYTAKCMEALFAASSSCLFVACLFESCIHKMNLAAEDTKSRIHSPLFKYYKQMMGAISVMHHISMGMCGTRAIMGKRVVSNIVTLGQVWGESKLKEHCNTYIDNLSDRYITLWDHLSSSSLANSEGLLHDAWKYVVESGYLALLEGFSKIHRCSTEGRALMSIDLATFAFNVSTRALTEKFRETIGGNREVLAPPAIMDIKGKQYVDTYIKVFYFPNEDIMKWISENRASYHLSHSLALVSNGAHNQMPPTAAARLQAQRRQIKNCKF